MSDGEFSRQEIYQMFDRSRPGVEDAVPGAESAETSLRRQTPALPALDLCRRHDGVEPQGKGAEPPLRQAGLVKEETHMEAYCFKCRGKREIEAPERVTLKNGNPAMTGRCPSCGTKVFRMVARGGSGPGKDSRSPA